VDGCDYAVYRLSERVIKKLRTRGLQALNGTDATPLNADDRNPYSPWMRGPMPLGKPIYALRGGGCNSPIYPFDQAKAVASDTSYFSLSRNLEGIWLVDTIEGILLFQYVG
jgi:hypothetical protein